MRKFLILFLSLFLFACGTGMEEQNNNENENNEQAVEINDSGEELKIETVFSQDMEESVDYSIFSIKLDETGDSILFTGEEEVDRASTYNEMLIDPNDNAHNALNFNPNDNEDRWCSDVRISQNGEYVVYDCHDDGIEFSVYDVKSEKTIKEVEEFDEYINDIIGISNEGVVFLTTTNDNRNAELITYDINDDTQETISLEDLLNIDDTYVEFNTMFLVNDGKRMSVGHALVLYLIDLETNSVEEIINFENDDDNEFFITKTVFSHDGNYAFYEILDDSLKDDNSEYIFHQLETGEKTSYKTFEYSTPKNIDKNGNALIKDDEQFYLYNILTETVYIIPDVEVGVYTKDYALSHDGNTLVYTDRDLLMDEDKYATQFLYRVRLGDYTNFETEKLHADADTPEKVMSDRKEIILHENDLDEIDVFDDLWESSTDQLFPTKFPRELEQTTHHYKRYSDGSTDYSMDYYIYFNSLSEDKISYRISPAREDGTCLFFDELEVVETVDGIDYLYYDFANSDQEAAVSINDTCYYFETDEDFTKDELLNMAKSLESIDKVFHKIPLDEIKLLKKLPIQSPNDPRQSIISYSDGDSVDFIVEYSDNQDDDISTQFEIRTSAPNFFEEREDNITLDVDGFEEGYYLTDYHKTILYDDSYYYVIELDLKDEDTEALGYDYLEDLFIEMAESLE